MKHVHGWAFPDYDEFMTTELSIDGTYQRSHLDAALGYVTDWSLAVDGGAHVGTWTAIMAGRFEKVIAIEPSLDTFEALSENVRAFGLTNVHLRNVALGAELGTVTMELDATNEARKNTGARFVRRGGTIPLEVVDVWRLESLGLLKLDVEGSEYAALVGALKTIKRCRPIVLFEDKRLWMKFGVEREGPQKLLTAAGYRRLVKVGCDEIWGPK